MRAWANQAKHRKTGRIHECHELASLPYAKDRDWVCPDERCAVPLIPCAWEPDKQPKKAPYFRTGKGQPHKPDCFIHGLEQLSVKGQKRRISTDGGFPVAYPSRVILAPRPATAENAGDYRKEMELSQAIASDSTARSAKLSLHNRTIRSIREACRFFINFPYDRDLPLRVDGCSGTRYDEIFVRIGRESEADIGPRRILYGEMKFRSEPVLSGDQLTITLFAHIGMPERKVIVDMAGWPQHHRNYLQKQLAEALQEARKAHRENDKRLRPWLFFVGTQKCPDQEVFEGLNCYPAIAILACEMPKVHSENTPSKMVSVQNGAANFAYSAVTDPDGLSDQVGAAYIPRRSTEIVPDQMRAQHRAHLTIIRAAPQATVRTPSVAEPSAKHARWLPQVRGTVLSWFRSLFG